MVQAVSEASDLILYGAALHRSTVRLYATVNNPFLIAVHAYRAQDCIHKI